MGPEGGGPSRPADAALRRTLVVVSVGAFLSVLELTVVNVALDTLESQLHGSIASVQWIVTAYLLALAATVPLTGWLSRRFGPRRLYIGALALFVVASGLCAIAWSVGSLVAFRVLQGAGGGALLPVAQALAARAAGPARMRRAIGAVGSVGVIAPVIGPLVGGVIVDQASWRWIFLINLPIGVAGVLMALRSLPPDEPEEAGSLDWVGLLTLGAGLPMVTYALAELGQGAPPLAVQGLPLGAVGLALIGFFIVHAGAVPQPLLELRLYRRRVFALAAAAMFTLGATLFGPYLLMPLFFQDVRGNTAIEAGLLFGAQGLGAGTSIWLGGRLHEVFTGPQLALAGSVIAALFTAPLTVLDQDSATALFVADLALRGFGIGLVFIPVYAIALGDLPRHLVADATAQFNVLMRVGGAAATALIAVLLTQELQRHAADTAGMAAAYQDTWRWTMVIHLLAIVPTLMLARLARRGGLVAQPAGV
ncbi:MAG TPA: DHA2 family efflux MFS transporter permease subunit [Baekduia sp.]